jgi:TPR repeat protein
MRDASDAFDAGKPTDALELYEALAKQGMPEGLVAFGGLYEDGIAVVQNLQTAERLFVAAAETGDRWGKYSLATHYQKYGNHVEARRIMEELAHSDYLPAINRLAFYLEMGLGGAADMNTSLALREHAGAEKSGVNNWGRFNQSR